MNMKQHILMAMHEQLDRWERQLDRLNEDQIKMPLDSSGWLIQDVMAHLMAWQQRTIARVEAALLDRAPEFGQWAGGLDPDVEDNTEAVNGWIYQTYHPQSWPQLHRAWRAGYERLLELAEQISEKDLLDPSRYGWLNDYPLAAILLATYDHHQEHFETFQQNVGQPPDPE